MFTFTTLQELCLFIYLILLTVSCFQVLLHAARTRHSREYRGNRAASETEPISPIICSDPVRNILTAAHTLQEQTTNPATLRGRNVDIHQ